MVGWRRRVVRSRFCQSGGISLPIRLGATSCQASVDVGLQSVDDRARLYRIPVRWLMVTAWPVFACHDFARRR